MKGDPPKHTRWNELSKYHERVDQRIHCARKKLGFSVSNTDRIYGSRDGTLQKIVMKHSTFQEFKEEGGFLMTIAWGGVFLVT